MNKDIEYKLRKKYLVRRPIVFTLLGSFSLLTLYFLILIFANSLQHAIQEFLRMWYWVLLLVIGFCFQICLFLYIIIGVLSNILDITYMLKIIQKHNLYTKKGNISKLMSINLNKLFFLAISLSIVIVVTSIFFIRR